MESLERDWPKFAGPEHVAPGVLPAYLTSTTGDATLWGKPSDSLMEYPERMAAAKNEGNGFCAKYDSDVRFVLARTNTTFACLRRKAVCLYLLVD